MSNDPDVVDSINHPEINYCCNWSVYTTETDPGDDGVINLHDVIEAGAKALGLSLYVVETDLVDCGKNLW